MREVLLAGCVGRIIVGELLLFFVFMVLDEFRSPCLKVPHISLLVAEI